MSSTPTPPVAANPDDAEFLKHLRESCGKSIAHSHALGIQAESAAADGAQTRLPCRPEFIGDIPRGVIAGFMENAALLHLLLLPIEPQATQPIPKNTLKSIDCSIDYLRSARAEDLYAQRTVERIGRRVAQVQIRCTQKLRGKDVESASQQGPSIALARAHSLLSATE